LVDRVSFKYGQCPANWQPTYWVWSSGFKSKLRISGVPQADFLYVENGEKNFI